MIISYSGGNVNMLQIFECSVKSVDSDSRVLNCTSLGGRDFYQVSWLLPWLSNNGGGFDAIPKQGDRCIVASDGQRTYVLGFAQNLISTSPTRESLEEGGIGFKIQNEDGSYAKLLLNNGGAVVLQANGVLNSFWNPIDSSVIHHFFNMEQITPGGFIKWRYNDQTGSVTYEAQYKNSATASEALEVKIRFDETPKDQVHITLKKLQNEKSKRLQIRMDQSGAFMISSDVSIVLESKGMIWIKAPIIRMNNTNQSILEPNGTPPPITNI